MVPYQSFKTADGRFLTVGAGNNAHFEQICDFLKMPDLPFKFPSNPERVERRDELLPILEAAFLTKTCDQWLEIFKSAKFPYGPVNSIKEAYSDPELLKTVVTLSHELSGKITVPGSPVEFDNPLESPKPAPLLGEHTKHVLKELGLSDHSIQQLFDDKIVG